MSAKNEYFDVATGYGLSKPRYYRDQILKDSDLQADVDWAAFQFKLIRHTN